MRSTHHSLAIVALFFAASLFSSVASSGLITQSFAGGNGSVQHGFNPFDSALGALTRVSFDFRGTHSVGTDEFTCTAADAPCTATGGFQLLLLTGDAFTSDRFITDALFSIDPAAPRRIANVLGQSRQFDASFTDLSGFESAPVIINWDSAFFNGPGRPFSPGDIAIEATLAYEFGAAVPAPSSLVLILIAMGLLRRRVA